MILLAVDVGNSSVKAALFRDGRRIRRGRPDRVAVSSVNPPLLKRLLPRLKALGLPVRVAGKDFRVPLRGTTTSMGTDRLLAAYAAWRRARGPAAVLSVGTAITLNVVDARGRFRGGAIFAGPRLALSALAEGTALLPEITLTTAGIQPLSQSTPAAIRSGALLAYRGFAREGLAAATQALRRKPAVFVTGGGAFLLRGALPRARFAPDLVLEGLARLVPGSIPPA